MIRKASILVLLGLLILSCANDDNATETFIINGEFRHTITGCDNTNNPEINCIESIRFIDEAKVDFLIDGNDIVNIGSYKIKDKTIEIISLDSLTIVMSFTIQDEKTLKRAKNDDIWIKVE